MIYSQGIRRGGAGGEQIFPEASRAPSGRVFEELLVYHFAVHAACLLIRREAFEVAGHFDEGLATAEDLDLSLRLAFHFQLLFAPGLVMVYNISPHGLWLTSAATGGASSDHGRVIERALRMLPDSPRYRNLREELPVRIAFHAMLPFILIGQFKEARTSLLEALRAHPLCGRFPWIRGRVKWATYKLLVNAPSPLAEARELCTQIEAATFVGSFKERCYARWMLAEIWADIILSNELRRRVGLPAALYAGFRAVAYAPVHVRLLSRLCRGLQIRASKWFRTRRERIH